jgi:TP901 family phage tail tape measure protein
LIDVGRAIGYLMLDTTNFDKGFQSALTSLNTLGDKSTTMGDKFTAAGTLMSKAGGTLTKKVTLPLVALGGAAVSTTSKFESSMSQVQATMGITKDHMSNLGGQTVNTMDALSDLAKELGAKTKFSAVEAADAINYMALAGYDVEKTYGMLPTVLNLAAAGNFDLARASDMVTDSQTALGLSIEETATMVDEWARAASKSNTSVEQLGEAILTVGGTAQYMAGGTDRLATVLGVLADNGIKGSEAGTHLRNMILKLASPTDDGAAAIERLGLSVFDADGKMRDFEDIFGDLQIAMKDLTDEERMQAFADLFNVRDIAAANALLGTSSERWEELGSAISNADGAAQEMADTQLDNLQGQLTILGSSLEGMAIAFGELLLPLIKDVVKFIQGLVDKINSLDDAQKEAIVRVAKVVAVVGPVLLILGKLFTLIGSLGKTIKALKTVMTALNAVFATTNPIALVVAAIAALVAAFIYLWNHCEGFRNFWINLWDTIKSAFTSVVEWIKGAFASIQEFFTGVWEGLVGLWGSIVGIASTIAQWFNDNVIQPIKDFFAPLVEWFTELFTSIWNFIKSVFEVIGQLAAGCVEIIKAVWGIVSAWFDENIIQPVAKFFTDLWNTISSAASTAWEAIKGVWTVVSTWYYNNIIAPVNNFFKSMWDKLKSGASAAWEGIKNVFSPVITWFKDKFSAAWNAVKNVFSTGGKIFTGIKEGIERTFKTVVNGIIRGINWVIAIPFNAINRVLDRIRSVSIVGIRPFSGLGSISVPQIPLLARGGILAKGQVGYLEGNGAEAVVPLDQNKKWISAVARDMVEALRNIPTDYHTASAGTWIDRVVININGAKYSNDRDLARAISYELQGLKDRGSRTWGGTRYETPVIRPRLEEV